MSNSYFAGGTNDPSGWFNSPGYGETAGGGGSDPFAQPTSYSSWNTDGYAADQPFGAPPPNQQPHYAYGFLPNEQLAARPTPDADVSIEDEPPLLEELGINFEHIKVKTLAVLNPLHAASAEVIQDQDLAGPLVFCLLFGGALLLHGKVHFGYIYGIGVLGCAGIYGLLNLMSVEQITLTCTVSVLGYCLLPMALLSMLGVLVSFQGLLGLLVAISAVLWCSLTSSKLFVTALKMDHQRLLVAYPCFLLYGMFALLAVF